MKKFTRDEIDKRLQKLRESNLNDETYTMTRPMFAMCYSMSFGIHQVTRKCNICGNNIDIKYLDSDDENLPRYEKTIKKFTDLGFDAKIACHCKSCQIKNNVKAFEFQFKADDEKEYHVSYPKHLVRPDTDVKPVGTFELELVLKFLTVPFESATVADFFDRLYNVEFREKEGGFKKYSFFDDKPPLDFSAEKNLTVKKAMDMVKEHLGYVKEKYDPWRGYSNESNYVYDRFARLFSERYSVLTYRGINNKDTVHDYDNAGFIKTQIDQAISSVLGLEIFYEKEEVIKNIELIYSQTEKMLIKLPLVLKKLENEWHEPFTLSDYIDFMDDCKEAFLKE